MRGLVVKNTGSWYTVCTDDGRLLDCKIKGNFRLKGIRSTNPVAVGDRVKVAAPSSSVSRVAEASLTGGVGTKGIEGGVFITEIEDRTNYIVRRSTNLSKQSHILAANVDQALLVVTIDRPQTSTTFIDRFLASAEAYRVDVVLVFNKTDLLDADGLRLQQMMVDLYETVGYRCVQVSATKGLGIDQLRSALSGKITLLSGNSGVGKSTLINRLVPGAKLRTADISDAWGMGMHTTTFSEMIALPSDASSAQNPFLQNISSSQNPSSQDISSSQNPSCEHNSLASLESSTARFPNPFREGWPGALIDTPGIKGFGTFDMEPEELTSYFREIFHFSKDCRFSNCTHTHEPGCAVLKALEEHYIAQSRYQSYLSMLNDKDDGKYREAY